ncbi:MAG: Uma2 family endonuclease [Eubacterium sp.]|nr:Uma2 family endonuclease [Eubacterium sp.]
MKYNDKYKETDTTMVRQEPAYNLTDSNDNPCLIKGVLTVSDLEETPEDRRVELINGVFYDMAEPLIIHQNIVGEIFGQLRDFIHQNNGNCKPYVAPVGVRPNADDDHTVLEPDVFVVCDPEKQKHPRYIIGGPDLVVEVLSESTKKRDMTIKKTNLPGCRCQGILDR